MFMNLKEKDIEKKRSIWLLLLAYQLFFHKIKEQIIEYLLFFYFFINYRNEVMAEPPGIKLPAAFIISFAYSSKLLEELVVLL